MRESHGAIGELWCIDDDRLDVADALFDRARYTQLWDEDAEISTTKFFSERVPLYHAAIIA